jgi:serine/threonine-protein kinase
MDFVGGGSLKDHLERFADPHKAAALVEKVARAVQHAHDRRIWHRDLKPSNVLLDEQDEPKVSDFGLAKLQDSDVKLTVSGAIVGTPAYMAPEQAGGQGEQVSAATDVWALGVVLFELLTGSPPFTGRRDDVLYQIRTLDPPRPRALQPALDRNLETITLKCLEKDPARRYPSAGALADDLGCWRRGEPIRARRQRWPARVLRTLRRRPTLVTATAISAIFAAVLVLVLTAEKTDPSEAALKDMERRLAAGQAVEVVGESGLPRYHRLRAGNGSLSLDPRHNNVPLLESLGISLLELVPDPQQERYQFSVDINESADAKAEMGIYFMHSVATPAVNPDHFFCTLTLKREGLPQGPLPGASAVGLGALPPGIGAAIAAGVATVERTWHKEIAANFHCRRFREFPLEYAPIRCLPQTQLATAAGGWYELAVVVTPEAVTALVGGEPLGVVRRSQLDRCARILTDLTPPGDAPSEANVPPPDFAPRGALGLFGFRGAAGFRHIVIKPLP